MMVYYYESMKRKLIYVPKREVEEQKTDEKRRSFAF
jgi:hypothetical protein